MTRQPWVSVIVSTFCATIAAPALIFDPDSFNPYGAYQYTFQPMGPRLWGVLFAGAGMFYIGGIVAPTWQRHGEAQKVLITILAGLLAMLLMVWAGFLVAAKMDPAGSPSSWLGPGVWLTLAACHMVSFARFGPGHR